MNGSFGVVRGDVHDLTLPHEVVPPAQGTVHVDDGTRRHISRIFGLQGPEPDPRETPATQTGAVRTEHQYGPDVHGLRALVRTAREYEANPAAFRERKFSVPGSRARYFWNELWTGPDRYAYRRTLTQMNAQVQGLDVAAYFVEGFARDSIQVVRAAAERWIKLKLDTDFEDSAREEIQLHLPYSEENHDHLQHITWQTPLAIWSHRVYRTDASFVLLTAPDWSHVLADGSEGMITAPRPQGVNHRQLPSADETTAG
ncbi:hypothetical protein ACIRCZ_18610 [Leifsonia sp. NPDC102414]|uniref:hypothetical protein n=1 Tax=Leifsonia sp. NPDC102414 TaxID=3364124 RepID=UPI003820E57D